MALLQIFGGFAWGYLLVSVTESAFHRWVHHAPRRVRRLWRSIPWLGAGLERSWYRHHVVHHLETFRASHTQQFRDGADQRALDSKLPERDATYIKRTRYGLSVAGTGLLTYVWPLAGFIPLTAWLFGSWALLGAVLPMLAFPLMSAVIHPWLHVRHDLARTVAPWPVGWLLGTRYMRAVARHHFMHHRHLTVNFNLLLGGDVLLGVHRPASETDLAAMTRAGIRGDR